MFQMGKRSFFLTLLASGILSIAHATDRTAMPEDKIKAALAEIAAQPDVDRIIWFANDPTPEQIKAIFSTPLAERDPLLVRMAFEQLKSPSAEQIQSLREVSANHAMMHLARLRSPESGNPSDPNPTPAQIAFVDQALRDALASDNFSDGWRESIARFEAIVEAQPKLKAAMMISPEEARSMNLDGLSKTQLEQMGVDVLASALAASQALPTYQSITMRCKGPELALSNDRQMLCWKLGQKMQREADTLITAIIGSAIEEYAAPSEHDKTIAIERKTSWRALTTSIGIEQVAAPNSNANGSLADAELRAAISSWEMTKRSKDVGEAHAYLEKFATDHRLVLSADRFEALQQVFDAVSAKDGFQMAPAAR
jgi:hypothetical protein